MTACVELHGFIKCETTMKHPPLVDLRVLGHPTQSVSLYASTFSAVCHAYLKMGRGHPSKYPPRLVKAITLALVGVDIYLQIFFVEYWMSGRSMAR